jgi:hypothetical protein
MHGILQAIVDGFEKVGWVNTQLLRQIFGAVVTGLVIVPYPTSSVKFQPSALSPLSIRF